VFARARTKEPDLRHRRAREIQKGRGEDRTNPKRREIIAQRHHRCPRRLRRSTSNGAAATAPYGRGSAHHTPAILCLPAVGARAVRSAASLPLEKGARQRLEGSCALGTECAIDVTLVDTVPVGRVNTPPILRGRAAGSHRRHRGRVCRFYDIPHCSRHRNQAETQRAGTEKLKNRGGPPPPPRTSRRRADPPGGKNLVLGGRGVCLPGESRVPKLAPRLPEVFPTWQPMA